MRAPRGSFGFVSPREREQADRFLSDWFGSHASEDAAEDYREVDDRTVFQGTTTSDACPVALPDLLRLYAHSGSELALVVNGRALRFTRTWTRGAEGTAVLRGRIRYELARRRADGGADAIRRAFEGVTGDPARLDDLRRDAASTRPVASSPILVEQPTGPGRSWYCRGYVTDGTETTAGNEADRSCPATDAEIRAVLGRRSDEQAQRAIREREHAARVNRLPEAEREREVADLIRREVISESIRPRHRLRTRFARFHAAWDIPAVRDTAIYTPLPGIVRHVGRSSSYGNHVRIEHDTIATRVVTNYCHLSAALVVVHQRVVAGLAVGLAGATGSAGGVHLHFSVQRPGAALGSDEELSHGVPAREWFREVTGAPA
jgi:hypothetical protein